MAFTDLMLDLETMGVGSNPCITEIAAVSFNRDTGETGNSFHLGIDLESCIKEGFQVSGSTVKFWICQTKEARDSFSSSQRGAGSIRVALENFSRFVEKLGNVKIWGNGIMADNRWLDSAYENLGMDSPIKHWNHADVRTIVDVAEFLGSPSYKADKFEGVKHNPVDDCKHQIKYVVNYLNFLKGVNK